MVNLKKDKKTTLVVKYLKKFLKAHYKTPLKGFVMTIIFNALRKNKKR